MSRDGSITLYFGEEERTFRLGMKELRKLQERCADKLQGERGPFRILRDLQAGDGRVDDILQPILLGLQGAGMKPEEAGRIVKERVEDRPLHENTITAMLILREAIMGPPEEKLDTPPDPPGKTARAESASTSPRSTRTGRSSVGRRGKSTK